MPNGRIGDHPLTDILFHDLVVFSPEIDNMVRELDSLGVFENEIARSWLADQSYLLYVARERGEVAYGDDDPMKEGLILSSTKNVLGLELRRQLGGGLGPV